MADQGLPGHLADAYGLGPGPAGDSSIAELGWETMRFTTDDLRHPAHVVHSVARMLVARQRLFGVTR